VLLNELLLAKNLGLSHQTNAIGMTTYIQPTNLRRKVASLDT
jgi:hypothetical protein